MLLVLFVGLSSSTLTTRPKEAEAIIGGFCIPCLSCFVPDTFITTEILLDLILQELIWDPIIQENIADHLNVEENFMVDEFFSGFSARGMAEMTEFLGAYGIYQVQMVGAFFDAKIQLETQRLFSRLQAEAHKDYQPSDDFCWFGTNTRSLASSESRGNLNRLVLSKRSISRQLGTLGALSSQSTSSDESSRWAQFASTYCDPRDNGWKGGMTGLGMACDRDGPGGSTASGATDLLRVNRDIDYARVVDQPKTIEVNFIDNNPIPSNHEEDIFALSANLYASDILTRRISFDQLSDLPNARELYMDLRSVVAKRSVAEDSFNAIVGMKSQGTADTNPAIQTGAFMAAIMKELMPVGTPDAEIIDILGTNPSYYAQLEVLSKKIYQNPQFFANLYDTPANVARKSVAMKAIESMLDRELLESELRQEMMMSVMLSSKLGERYRTVNRDLSREFNK